MAVSSSYIVAYDFVYSPPKYSYMNFPITHILSTHSHILSYSLTSPFYILMPPTCFPLYASALTILFSLSSPFLFSASLCLYVFLYLLCCPLPPSPPLRLYSHLPSFSISHQCSLLSYIPFFHCTLFFPSVSFIQSS